MPVHICRQYSKYVYPIMWRALLPAALAELLAGSGSTPPGPTIHGPSWVTTSTGPDGVIILRNVFPVRPSTKRSAPGALGSGLTCRSCPITVSLQITIASRNKTILQNRG
jgi:hypothetical protein